MFSIVAEKYKYVVGVDTHAKKHVATIVNNLGAVIVTRGFKVTPKQIGSFLDWVIKITGQDVIFAIEGTSSYGETLARAVLDRGLTVAEVKPPKTKSRGGIGKTDLIDSKMAALSILGLPVNKLATPRTDHQHRALRMLLGARRNLIGQQTACKNALTALLWGVELGVDARKPLTPIDHQKIANWRIRANEEATSSIDQLTARREAKRLADNIIINKIKLDENKQFLAELVNELAPGLLDQPGIGPVSLAQVICSYSHKGRIHSAEAFAALAGTTPIPDSSGNTNHYRLNHYGDRQLNHAITTIVMSRMRTDDLTKQYVTKRTSDGLGKRDIRRSLKRYVARSLFKQLESCDISAGFGG